MSNSQIGFVPVKFCIKWTLCLYYSLKTIILFIILFFTKSHTKFWVVKRRTVPPKCLLNHNCGENKYITVNNIKLHYVENGDPNKPLMLFLHGFPEFWYSWRYQIKEFSNDYWTIALDMRGYGDSDKPESVDSYKIDKIAEDIKAFVTALGRKKFILIGHDWGSVVGWHYVMKHMDTIDKYVMMGAPSLPVARQSVESDWDQFRKSWYIFFFQMPYLPEFALRTFDLKAIKAMASKDSKYCTADDLEAYKYTFAKRGALTCPLNYYRANFEYTNTACAVPTSYSPGLYLLGELDIYVSKNSIPLILNTYENVEAIIVDGANHFLQQDSPDKVNALIWKFLKAS